MFAGKVQETDLKNLGNYGAKKVLYVADDRLNELQARAFTRILVAAAKQENSPVVITLHDVNGRAIALV